MDKEQRSDNPGAENAPREREVLRGRTAGGLFDIVKNDDGSGTCLLGITTAPADAIGPRHML